MFRLFCFFGLHSWRQTEDRLGGFGMGLEWFNCWECRRCRSTKDCIRRAGPWEPSQVIRDGRPRQMKGEQQ